MLKLGSMSLVLGLMLTPLCQAQQWSGDTYIRGVPNSVPYASQVPGTNILQVFYRGADNALWTLCWKVNPV